MNAVWRRAALACSLAVACSLVACRSSVQQGGELFELHCVDCHEMNNPYLKKQPPKLEGLFQHKTLPSGTPATDEQVSKTIIEGLGTMPAFQGRLKPDEVNDLVRYLHTLN